MAGSVSLLYSAGMGKMHAAPYGALLVVATCFKRAVTREGVHALTRDSARKRGGPLPSPSQPGLGMVPTTSGLFNDGSLLCKGIGVKVTTARTTKRHPGSKFSVSFWAFHDVDQEYQTRPTRRLVLKASNSLRR